VHPLLACLCNSRIVQPAHAGEGPAWPVFLMWGGLLAAVAAFYVSGLFIFFPVTANLRAWSAGAGVTALVVLAALTLFGFTTALAGRQALGKGALE